MLRKFRKLAEITPSEWFILLQLILFSFAAAVALTLVGLSPVIGFMARCAVKPRFSFLPLLHARHEIARLATLVDLASRVTHGQKRCLLRSVLLFWLLKARNEPARLVIGVSKVAALLESHAWIETEGKLMGDSPEMTARFVAILRL